jgi:hypothetical protein
VAALDLPAQRGGRTVSGAAVRLVAALAGGFAGSGEFLMDASHGARHGADQVTGGGARAQVCEASSGQFRCPVRVVSRPGGGSDAGSG